jgi:hypothetical protein
MQAAEHVTQPTEYNAGSGTYQTRIFPFVPSFRPSFSVFKEYSIDLSHLAT